MPDTTSIHKPKIFLSHASEDKPFVRRLEAALEAAGVEVWVDHDDLHAGENFPKRIGEALAWCDVLLLVWSQAARVSRWVEMEWSNALSLRKVIIPCRLDKTPLPPLLDSISYATFRDFERGLEQLLHALRNLSSPKVTQNIEPSPPPESNVRDRRIDAATPSTAEVGQRLDLLVQVRFPDSPLLGREDWPTKIKPDHIEQTSESVALQFPVDPATGKLTSAKLEIQIVAPDFEIAGNARQRVLVPPEEYSKCLSFLITPKQTGVCRINVEVYDVDQTFLGAIPLETNIGGSPVAQALNVANLMLFVVVGQERIALPPILASNQGIGSLPPPSSAPPAPASEGTKVVEYPTYQPSRESRHELPQSKAPSGCLGRVALWLGILASLATVLAFVFDLPDKFDWFTPASSTFYGSVRYPDSSPVPHAVLRVQGNLGEGTTDAHGNFNFRVHAQPGTQIRVTVAKDDIVGFDDLLWLEGDKTIPFDTTQTKGQP
ncbi:toll/interleukin-1 receptor domain-containing protein [candidate division KSB1 bacterium]|nr:toll/interleukin-1 receptor domain-containing protein [candidate division KSB1 bacterium]